MVLESDLPKGTIIPYCGALMVQAVDGNDLTSPKELVADYHECWNRICLLGHQPIVTKGPSVSAPSILNLPEPF